MTIDYADIGGIIEHIIDKASKQDYPTATIDDLYEYLEENLAEEIKIIKRN